jgi:hypothetical protein
MGFYSTGWIDLGRGYLSSAVGNALALTVPFTVVTGTIECIVGLVPE